jgi:hypothetical protein
VSKGALGGTKNAHGGGWVLFFVEIFGGFSADIFLVFLNSPCRETSKKTQLKHGENDMEFFFIVCKRFATPTFCFKTRGDEEKKEKK